MVIGLGTGSTMQYALEAISNKIKNGDLKEIIAVPSSTKTEKRAKELGIPLRTMNELIIKKEKFSILNSQFAIDLTIDGADEVCVVLDSSDEGSNQINLIKGGGGALLKEKIIAQNCNRLSIIVDENKLSDSLGTKSSLPVEVIPFAVESEKKFLESLGAKVFLRKDEDGNDFISDEGNNILDAEFGEIKNVNELNNILNERAGIVEHGLFLNLSSVVYCGTNDGVKVFKMCV
jgi:ribose 5-phosphate isomerase A